jgi:hypothetical protein
MEHEEMGLYNVLQKLNTKLLQAYLVAAQETGLYTGVQVAARILLERWRKDEVL